MIVPARLDHIAPIAGHMRAADRRECVGKSPESALRISLLSSLWAMTVLIEGTPQAMFGVSPVNMMQSIGSPWMLATDLAYDYPRLWLKYTTLFVHEMHSTFNRLENCVSVDNDRAISFLKHFGFKIGVGAVDIGGVTFTRFERVQPSTSDCGERGDNDGRAGLFGDGSVEPSQIRPEDRQAEYPACA